MPSKFRFNPLTGNLDLTDVGGGGGGGGPHVSFYSYLSGNLDNVTGDGTLVDPIIYDAVTANNGNGYDETTGIFTCPAGAAGDYMFFNVMYWSGLESGHIVGGGNFIVNGQQFKAYALNPFAMSEGTDLTQCAISGLVTLAEGDTVYCDTLVSGGAKTVEIAGGLGISSFSGILIKATGSAGNGIVTLEGDSGSTSSAISKIMAGPAGGQVAGASVHFGQGFPDSLVLYLGDSDGNTLLGVYAGPLGGSQGIGIANNTGLGYGILSSLTAGAIYNTANGYGAGGALLTGKYNAIYGFGQDGAGLPWPAGRNYTGDESGNILINHSGVTGDNKVMRLGHDDAGVAKIDQTFIAGIKGVTLGGSPSPVVIDPSTGQLGEGTASSDLIGSMKYFANAGGDSNLLAAGWLKCNGQVVAQATYPDLFTQVGLINPPGQFWTNAISSTTTTLSAVAGGAGRYVAVGNGLVMTSSDAKTWSRGASPQANGLFGVTYGDKFVAVGSSLSVIFSTNGVDFDTRLPSMANVPNALLYTTKFVGFAASNVLFTSTDGVLFRGRNGAFLDAMNGATALTFGNSLYMTCGTQGFIATSTDAITWTRKNGGTTSSFAALTYGTQFVAGGVGGVLKTSTDGNVWATQTSGTTSTITVLAYCNSLYLLGATGGGLATSTDAVTWTSRASQTTSTIQSFTYGGVYVYGAGGGRIASSTDATTWTNRTSGTTSTINAMIFANSLYVFGANGGGISTSTDGTTWNARTSNLTGNIQGLVWDGSLFWAMCDSQLATSTDAITWTARSIGITVQTFIGLSYNGSIYLASGNVGGVSTSTDGLTWTSQSSGTTANLLGNTWGNGIFALAGSAGTILTTTDGVTYTSRSSGTTTNYNAITYDSTVGRYLAVGGIGTSITSTDAITWATNTAFTLTAYNAAISANGIYYIGAANGQIWTSTDSQNFTLATQQTTSTIVSMGKSSANLVAVGNSGSIQYAPAAYPYDTSTQFQIPNDAGLGITVEPTLNFNRSLYIKAA